jgi:hypothetical protein
MPSFLVSCLTLVRRKTHSECADPQVAVKVYTILSSTRNLNKIGLYKSQGSVNKKQTLFYFRNASHKPNLHLRMKQ